MIHLNYKAILFTGLILLSTISLTGCSESNTPQTLRIGLMSDVGAVPFLVAKENGFFEAQGLDVEIDVFKSALDRDSALQTGNLDGAMSDMLAAVFFYNSGQTMSMASTTYGNYTLVSSPILNEQSLLSLDKISIGLSSNTVIDYTTDKIAIHNGFESQLEKVAIPQMPIRLEMLSAGELNGATLPEPLSFAALLNGGTTIGSTQDFNLHPGVFIIPQKELSSNLNAWKKFYVAYNEAVLSINERKSIISFDLLADQLGFPSSLSNSYQLPKYPTVTSADEDTFIDVVNWMLSQGLIEESIPYNKIADSVALPN